MENGVLKQLKGVKSILFTFNQEVNMRTVSFGKQPTCPNPPGSTRNIFKGMAFFFVIALLGGMFIWPTTGNTQEKTAVYPPAHSGVYLKLTEDFYRALREESDSGSRRYSTDRSNHYLREIAVSTRFMVETNLQILKQQESIIRLLEVLKSQN